MKKEAVVSFFSLVYIIPVWIIESIDLHRVQITRGLAVTVRAGTGNVISQTETDTIAAIQIGDLLNGGLAGLALIVDGKVQVRSGGVAGVAADTDDGIFLINQITDIDFYFGQVFIVDGIVFIIDFHNDEGIVASSAVTAVSGITAIILTAPAYRKDIAVGDGIKRCCKAQVAYVNRGMETAGSSLIIITARIDVDPFVLDEAAEAG